MKSQPLRPLTLAISLGLPLGYGAPSVAFESLEGSLIAQSACSAPSSIKRGNNPGRVRLRVGQHYPVTGLNEPQGTYVQVRVDGSRPELRWVKRSCGELRTVPDGGRASQYVLALSWQPAFCEIKPDKTECRTQVPGRFDADHFALHGLWPQPAANIFCGVSDSDRSKAKQGRWEQLPEPDLRPETLTRLREAMPGTASHLQRHEFTKHGTCFPGSAENYYAVSLSLLEQVNGSHLREWIAGRIGGTVSTQELKRAFEQTFGAGTGAALGVQCIGDVDSRRTLVQEVRLSLKGPLTETTRLRDALDPSRPATSDCARGIVDPVGLN